MCLVDPKGVEKVLGGGTEKVLDRLENPGIFEVKARFSGQYYFADGLIEDDLF